jgi:apolipoprotein N-acyltransferase
LVLIAGGISATGFAPLNLWPLTLLCLALLMHWVPRPSSGKRAFLLGWAFGVGHFTIGNNWIATAFTYQANMPAWLGWVRGATARALSGGLSGTGSLGSVVAQKFSPPL